MDQLNIVGRAGDTLAGFTALGPRGVQSAAAREWLRVSSAIGCALGDAAAIFGAAIAAALLRFGGLAQGSTRDLLLVILPAYLLAALVFRSYRLGALTDPLRSASRALGSLLIAIALTAVSAYAFKVGAKYSRLEAGYLTLAAAALLVLWRVIVALGLSRFEPLIKPRISLLTDKPSGHAEAAEISAVVNVHDWRGQPSPDDPAFLNAISKRLGGYDRIVLSFDQPALRSHWTEIMRRTGLHSEVLEPGLSGVRPLALGWLADAPTLVISRGPLSFGERFAKRLLDLAVVMVLAPAVVPLLCLIAIGVKLDSPGPALFVQRRVGQNNRQFDCYKFRTMRNDALDPNGDRSTGHNDVRVTRLGRFLRRFSLDELPQLWNVLKGEMSLVGPRPHALGSTAEGQLFWEAMQGYWLRHSVKPGMTGLAQIRGLRGPTQSRDELEQRVAADLEYINTWSLWLDIRILLATLTVLRHEKAY